MWQGRGLLQLDPGTGPELTWLRTAGPTHRRTQARSPAHNSLRGLRSMRRTTCPLARMRAGGGIARIPPLGRAAGTGRGAAMLKRVSCCHASRPPCLDLVAEARPHFEAVAQYTHTRACAHTHTHTHTHPHMLHASRPPCLELVAEAWPDEVEAVAVPAGRVRDRAAAAAMPESRVGPSADVARSEPRPGADVEGASPVPMSE